MILMVKIYTTPSCSSCKKAKQWLDERKIEYQEKNIFKVPITKQDIKLMLENTENGFEDIISTRSKYIQDNNIDINNLKVSELEQMIIDNPSILKRPIIVQDKKLQIGYNEEDIRVFIPEEIRKEIICNSCDAKSYKEQLEKYYQEHKVRI